MTMRIAIAGATGISNLLQTVRQKLTELSNEGITTAQRQILTDDFDQLLSQAANFIDNAVFNGVNLLDTSANSSVDVNTLSNLDGGILTLTAQDLRTTIESLAGVSASLVAATGATAAQSAISGVYSTLESTVNSALGSLGAEVRALELQTQFLEEISDATEEGLGNIVDADLARESARLTSYQVQQQLSVQTLGIANQRPQSQQGQLG